MTTRVEYDRVAPDYDRRFRYGGLPGVAVVFTTDLVLPVTRGFVAR